VDRKGVRIMVDQTMPFGQFKGRELRDIPTMYLDWALRVCKLGSGLRQSLADEMVRRGLPPPPAPSPQLPRCPDCKGLSGRRLTWQRRRDGRWCIRVECTGCQRFLGFAPLIEPFMAAADRGLERG
jgi:hypothetical protein